MSYQSGTFIAFSAVVLLLYYCVGKKRQLYVLALANLAFFLISGLKYVPFILVTMLATYFTGRKIGKIYDSMDIQLAACTESSQKKLLRQKAKSEAKKYLLLGLAVAVALLAVCKYIGFAVRNLNLVLGAINLPQIQMFKMILPIGISFYTFMSLSYVLDVYWKRYKAEKSFLMYAVFVSYFPHVVQGPIDRFNEFKKQVENGIDFHKNNLIYGAELALWGFFKKLVVADRLALFVNEVIDNNDLYDGIYIILAFLVYSVQIYADFSGCIDIVSGVSEAFGIKLRKNFNHPYFSKTMGEFWRRWHISLQEWFKDYVYFPVSTSRFVKNGKKRLKGSRFKRAESLFASCVPIVVVWVVTGVWHGAAWKYVVWGMYHCALLVGSQVFAPVFTKLNSFFRVDTENFGWGFLCMVRTYLLCCMGRVFFRANGFMDSLFMIKKVITSTNPGALMQTGLSIGLDNANLFVAFVGIIAVIVIDALQEKMKLRETLSRQNLVFRWTLVLIGLFAVIILGIYGPEYSASSFIYEQF